MTEKTERRQFKPYSDKFLAKIYYELKQASTAHDRARLIKSNNLDEEILYKALDIYCEELKKSVKADFKDKIK